MCKSLQIRTVTSLAEYNNLPAELKGYAQQLRITQYNTFTNPDETDCSINNLGITFGFFPWKCHEPKVQITAPNRQNGRVFENLDMPEERILSVTSLPKNRLNKTSKISKR